MLFIYYSLSGNGDVVAEAMKEKGYEIRKIETVKKMPESMFSRIMQGGFKASVGYKDKLKDYDKSLDGHDEVVVGAPIWAGKLASPLNTVLRDIDFSGKKLTFILYAGSGEGPKAERYVKKLYPEAKVIMLKEPKVFTSELEKTVL